MSGETFNSRQWLWWNVATCIKCDREAITFIRYNGSHLCDRHFLEFVEKRVHKEVRRQVDLNGKHRLAVALSGGKDSSVALTILRESLRGRRDLELLAILVDEGIVSYRPKTIETAEALCNLLDVELHVVRQKDVVGKTMDEIAPRCEDKTPCSYCGVIRRKCMNKLARELGADVLATGLNLDDTAQSILMNFTKGDVEKMARLGPHTRIQAGLVPRIQPLRSIPEKESYLYAIVRDLPFSDAECPYAEAAMRNEYRQIIDQLESNHPGTRHSIVASYDAIQPLLAEAHPPAELHECECGEPTKNPRCKSCEMLEEVKGWK